MTLAEAAEVLEFRQIMWPNAVAHVDPLAEARVWAKMFAAYPGERVAAAVESFSGEFAPTLPQIREALNPTPTYATALQEFEAKMRQGFSPTYTSPKKIEWSHPMIAAFAEEGWWERFGGSPDAVSDPTMAASEAAWRAHFREGFKGSRARYVSRVEIGGGTGRTEIGEGRREISD